MESATTETAIGIPLDAAQYRRTHEAPSFRLHHNRVRWPRFLHRVAEESARRTRAGLAVIGCKLPPPLEIYVRSFRPGPRPAAAYVPPGAGGPAIALNLFNPYPFPNANPYFWVRIEALLVHEWVHAAIDAHCHGRPLPGWLDEGLAVLLGRALAPSGAVDRPELPVHAACVRRLVARVGWEGVMARLPGLARADEWPAAMGRAFGGLTLEQLALELSTPLPPQSRLPRRLVGERVVAGALSHPLARPTALAVCLRLDRSLSGLPELSAIGSGARAARLVARAREDGIPVVADAALAGALTRGREVGDAVEDAALAQRVHAARPTSGDPLTRALPLESAERVRGLRLVVGRWNGTAYRLGAARRPGPPFRPASEALAEAARRVRPGEPVSLD